MKTNQEIAAIFKAAHKEPQNIPGMACELWEDGEITLTKCSNGELYGQRNLHLIFNGDSSKALPLEVMPVRQNNGHGFVRVESVEEAQKLWQSIQ